MRVAIMICAGALLQSVAASAVSRNERSLSISLRSLSTGPGSLNLRRQDNGDDGGNDNGDDNGDGDNGDDGGNDNGDDNGDGDNGDGNDDNSPDSKYIASVCFMDPTTITTPCAAFASLAIECQANGMLSPVNLSTVL